MTTKDQAIRNPHPSELRRTRPIHEAVGASPQPPAPDCRTCEYYRVNWAIKCSKNYSVCTNGDQYTSAPAVVLWRTE